MITIEEFKKKHSNKVRFLGLDLGSKRIGISVCDVISDITQLLLGLQKNPHFFLVSFLEFDF